MLDQFHFTVRQAKLWEGGILGTALWIHYSQHFRRNRAQELNCPMEWIQPELIRWLDGWKKRMYV